MNAPKSPLDEKIAAIPDLATALGEIRCLTRFAYPQLVDRIRTRPVEPVDVIAMVIMSIASRLTTDSDLPVEGAAQMGACGCADKDSVMAAYLRAAEMFSKATPPAQTRGTGQYL